MDFLGTILWPIRWAIELIIVAWHYLFTAIGMDAGLGITWVLSIVGLVVVVRSALIPLFVRQIKSQRRMMEISPQLKKIQDKYKGKKDQFSREAMSRETMAMYKNNGTSPFASCMPILVQMPIFFGLFSVLRNASDDKAGVGLLTKDLAHSFANAEIFGAPLNATFTGAWENGPWQVMVIAAVLVILMTASQFYTQLQITSKNVSDETKASPMYKQQRILLYIIPFMFVFSGVAFPLGLNFYWFTSNVWAMVQQFIIIRQMPTPGSEAYRLRQQRLARKGKLEAGPEEETTQALSANQKAQRQQPMSKKRAKKNPGATGGSTAPKTNESGSDDTKDSGSTGSKKS
ncbi:membrane protein insertase YidC [Lysinibacter cavernae]|uniref:Membrane protein insertase YidC n=1 Tax=Lysinibacter cavernae TaxID=1640652 RepID=A0A7X5R2U7_9MICO|nr:membrane protein insertase YidC [Lysinibacter cavernae]NIH54645.1 YidC/Oxa1 family membrane protein insertase [Lysinibacter cavernae]